MHQISPAGKSRCVVRGTLSGLVVVVAGDRAVAHTLRGEGAVVIGVRPWLAAAVCEQVRPDVVVVAAEDRGRTLAGELSRDPALYPLATVLVAARESLGDHAGGPWTATVGLPAAPAELLGAVRTAAQLRRLRDELLQAQRRFEHDALADPLTGRPNRRHVERSLDAMAAAARRHRRPLSAILLDLDRFKAINDEHGHAAGDAILRGVCDRLAGRLRAEDVLGRLGGDELIVLLPETGARDGAALAELLCRTVAATPFPVPGGLLGAQVSAGHATLHDGEDVGALLRRADLALYAAKHGGRGRAGSAEDLTTTASAGAGDRA